jgi:hypothetical protein
MVGEEFRLRLRQAWEPVFEGPGDAGYLWLAWVGAGACPRAGTTTKKMQADFGDAPLARTASIYSLPSIAEPLSRTGGGCKRLRAATRRD